MIRTQQITLDVYEAPYFVYVNAKQKDNDSRVLVITLTDEGKEIKPDHTSDTAVFRARKPDGTCVLDPATIGEDGKITVALSDQTLAVPGDVEADIAVVNGDDILSTASFYIQVARAPLGQEIVSENEFLVMVEATAKAEEAAAAANTAAEAANEATDAANKAEAARAKAEQARADAEAARTAKEKERADAETTRAEAESAREQDEAARKAAETARAEAEKKRAADTAQTITNAETATGAANIAAGNADAATGRANDAAKLIEDMTVSALDVEPGGKAAASLTKQDGHYNLALELVKGEQGLVGPVGPTGPQGLVGPVGPAPTVKAVAADTINTPGTPTVTAEQAGSTVTLTFDHLKGAVGATGPAGPAGPAGPIGPTGLTGPAGPTGPQGPQGPAGTNGVSPHIDQTTGNWFIGSSDTKVHAQGPQGPAGATGAQGPAGPAGSTGPAGPAGATGPAGPKGDTGPQGPVGPQGPAPSLAEVFLTAHPVGSYYWSSNATSPASLFGGTWAQITDRFVLAAGSTYKIGNTGGEASHILTVNEMPSHNHKFNISHRGYEYAADGYWTVSSPDSGKPEDYTDAYYTCPTVPFIQKTGSDGAHNNMPPYIVAYCWRRTA